MWVIMAGFAHASNIQNDELATLSMAETPLIILVTWYSVSVNHQKPCVELYTLTVIYTDVMCRLPENKSSIIFHSSGTKAERRSRVDREADNQQLLALEEKDVISSVATLLADLCVPGEWMPMEKLHAEVGYYNFLSNVLLFSCYSV